MSDTEQSFVNDVFDLCDELPRIRDLTTMRMRVLGAVSRVGVKYFVAARLPQPCGRFGPHHLATVWPENWLAHYDRSGYLRHDPVVAHCFQSVQPFFWSSIKTRPDSLAARVMNEAAEHGMAEGISVPIYDESAFTGGVSIAGERLEMSPRMARAVHLLGIYFYHAAEALFVSRSGPGKPLSPREREVLTLVAGGGTACSIADALGLAHDTVERHMKNARLKLGVKTTTQAVVGAMRNREIRL